ncbi:MAG TPA: FAD-dependent oxidoreductase [Actinomycetota bacterium]|nr:FAD-dependent oxidoreductase [Actinomycetota bacterium]
MLLRVLVLGAGFGGLELTSRLDDAVGDDAAITLIDRSDAFVFGFSKLDVMFGTRTPAEVRYAYRDIARPRVDVRRETVVAIDPAARRVVTDEGTYDADVLVVALGADLDTAATAGLEEGGDEFYSVEGAERLRGVLPGFEGGRAIVGVTGPSFKCPPAPSEAALLLDAYLRSNGRRDATQITLVMPFGTPIPPSPDTSAVLLTTFEERGIRFVNEARVDHLDPGRRVAVLDGGDELPYDLFLGIPVHRVPEVVAASGLAVDGWVPVDAATLATAFPDVYAVGDVTSVGTPKAGVFAEGAARVVADGLIARIRGTDGPDPYAGRAACYIEFGDERVGRVDVDFLTGPSPTGTFAPPSPAIAAEKGSFASDRIARWFGT